jgi:hypothetical protein
LPRRFPHSAGPAVVLAAVGLFCALVAGALLTTRFPVSVLFLLLAVGNAAASLEASVRRDL